LHSSQNQQQFLNKLTNGSQKSIGTGGIFVIIAVASALLIAGVAVIKKRLSKKVNK